MRLVKLPENNVQKQQTDILEKTLLDRVIKLRKLNKEMKDNVHVQRAEDMLVRAKAPFKKARAIWLSEVEAIELELRSRNIKFNINFDDIFTEDSEVS
jgi:hypothetical protein